MRWVWLLALPFELMAQQRYSFTHPQMGTYFNLVFYASDARLANDLAAGAFQRIDSLNAHLSDYAPDSELNQLSATAGTGQKVPVRPDLWTVLRAAQKVSRKSQGAFDATAGATTRLWRRAFRHQEFPDTALIEAARKRTGYRAVHFFPFSRKISLQQVGARLDLGGIAKGYAVDEVFKMLKREGIRRALVDGGGDVMAGAPPPGESGWRIACKLLNPQGMLVDSILVLSRKAVATSGDTYRYLEWQGIRYSHIIDPQTGYGVTHRCLATVLAPTCMYADAWATAISVIGPGKELPKVRRVKMTLVPINTAER